MSIFLKKLMVLLLVLGCVKLSAIFLADKLFNIDDLFINFPVVLLFMAYGMMLGFIISGWQGDSINRKNFLIVALKLMFFGNHFKNKT